MWIFSFSFSLFFPILLWSNFSSILLLLWYYQWNATCNLPIFSIRTWCVRAVVSMNIEQAATKIQAVFRGHKVRASMKQGDSSAKSETTADTTGNASGEPSKEELQAEFREDDKGIFILPIFLYFVFSFRIFHFSSFPFFCNYLFLLFYDS